MSLKGTTIIELTDIHTGEKEVSRDTNMITNAVSRVFGNNLEGMLFYINGSIAQDAGAKWSEHFLPICPNTIGGVLLFPDAITENVNTIYAPMANKITGYSSNDANSTTDTLRGSMNQTESMKTDHGYKLVFDFATSQGNGNISAVCLTHKYGGVGYFGSPVSASKKFIQMKDVKTSGTKAAITALDIYSGCVEINFEGNYLVSIDIDTSANIVITKARKCFTAIGLNFSLAEDGLGVMETQTITPTVFIASSGVGTYDFHDGEDGYWYGFMSDGNSSGSAAVKWIKISKTDYTFTEGTWTLPDTQISAVGYQHNDSYSVKHREIRAVMRGGYLYAMGYSKTGMYKINANNSADITFIAFGFTSAYANNYVDMTTRIYKLSDRIIGSDFVIAADDNVIQTPSYPIASDVHTPFFQYGPYAVTFGKFNNTGTEIALHKILWLVTPYLASINNLATPVTKTADKTMKITYTLEETE